ncbi:MAG: Membrane-associated enzyme (Acid phosphatase) superfamily [Polaromonas sp.]|jgi:membrane-associated PAP2 superfamily phosphatase|nr:Membrane-associated enzyme (Acid phosphatase) superfamily [Polaromonas sp.]
MLRVMQSSSDKRIAVITAGVAIVLLAWDAWGFDLPMAQWFGGLSGFPLQENWFLTNILHDGVKRLAWALALLLCLGVWFPQAALKRLQFSQRLQFAVTTLLAVTVVSSLKVFSATSCPWSLAEFGGIAHYASHWAHLFEHDGGSGGCFPAGHASSGFAFLGGYFAFRQASACMARKWLIGALIAGMVFGMAQQLRGAHFMSHTLWTGWICWVTAWGVNSLMRWFNFAAVTVDLAET